MYVDERLPPMERDTSVASPDNTHLLLSPSHCQPVQDDYVATNHPANDADVRGMCSIEFLFVKTRDYFELL